ncbi:MAG TPA: metal-sensitive transcriptional regulator [Actinomycetota bacterium]|nr:metal-sensitive transcriptional regulator [Actinomycetota bacterium]
MYGYAENKDELRARLRRIEGQVRGIERMVEDDEYCIDILTQISAASSALKKVSVALLEDHMRHCVADASTKSGSAREGKVVEAADAIARLLKS